MIGRQPEPADPTRRGVVLRDPVPWHDFVQLARTAEQTGYEALFVPEIAGREGFSTLAALARETEHLWLGTGVVPVAARRLSTTAMAAATVQEVAGGRFVLGVGSGPAAAGALERTCAAVERLRVLLAGGASDLDDEGPFRLDLRVPPPPIWLAALGDGMIRLAGEVADGVLLNWCTPRRVAEARALVEDAARTAGRDPTAITVAVYVRATLGHDEGTALDVLRAAARQYAAIPHYRLQFERMGLGSEAAAVAAHRDGAEIPGAPSERLVREVCLLGRPAEAERRIEEYRRAGADLPLVYPVPARDAPSSIMGTIFALAPMPAFS